MFNNNSLNNKIQVLDSNGNQIFTFGSAGTGNRQFMHIYKVLVYSNNRIIVADRFVNMSRIPSTFDSSRIQVFDRNGIFQF